jgi:hypothetical protein
MSEGAVARIEAGLRLLMTADSQYNIKLLDWV